MQVPHFWSNFEPCFLWNFRWHFHSCFIFIHWLIGLFSTRIFLFLLRNIRSKGQEYGLKYVSPKTELIWYIWIRIGPPGSSPPSFSCVLKFVFRVALFFHVPWRTNEKKASREINIKWNHAYHGYTESQIYLLSVKYQQHLLCWHYRASQIWNAADWWHYNRPCMTGKKFESMMIIFGSAQIILWVPSDYHWKRLWCHRNMHYAWTIGACEVQYWSPNIWMIREGTARVVSLCKIVMVNFCWLMHAGQNQAARLFIKLEWCWFHVN